MPDLAITFVSTSLDDPVAQQIHARYLLDIETRYGTGPGDVPSHEFDEPAGQFVIARNGAVVVGCAGIRRRTDRVAELKRMYVVPEARGLGVARSMLTHLEAVARRMGYTEVWLETGTEQPEAMSLYDSSGYLPIAPYGAFRDSPLNRCYGKELDSPVGVPPVS